MFLDIDADLGGVLGLAYTTAHSETAHVLRGIIAYVFAIANFGLENFWASHT